MPVGLELAGIFALCLYPGKLMLDSIYVGWEVFLFIASPSVNNPARNDIGVNKYFPSEDPP